MEQFKRDNLIRQMEAMDRRHKVLLWTAREVSSSGTSVSCHTKRPVRQVNFKCRPSDNSKFQAPFAYYAQRELSANEVLRDAGAKDTLEANEDGTGGRTLQHNLLYLRFATSQQELISTSSRNPARICPGCNWRWVPVQAQLKATKSAINTG